MYRNFFKRGLDITLCLLFILVFWWLYLILAILVRTKLGSPILFTQARPGKNEKIFKLYKFRTMTDARDENGNLLPDSVRLTKFGKLLRSLSLDELPELFNIIKGDMSIVGPRPLLVEYLPLYSEEQHHRHDVLPGLTGWAQVNGRNTVTWGDKFEMDVYYTRNISFWFDVKIIFLTAMSVLRREGISAEGEATVAYFTGNNN